MIIYSQITALFADNLFKLYLVAFTYPLSGVVEAYVTSGVFRTMFLHFSWSLIAYRLSAPLVPRSHSLPDDLHSLYLEELFWRDLSIS